MGRTHGASNAFLHRRLHGPRRIQPQDCLRYAGGDAGRRGRRPGCLLGGAGPGRGAQASSRHHPHVHRRARGCGGRGGGRVAPAPLERETESAPAGQGPTQPRRALASAPRAAFCPLGMALHHLPSRRPFAYRARLDQQLWRAPVLLRSTRAGMRAASCSSPSRWCGDCFCWPSCCRGCWGSRTGEIGARRVRFRGRGWALFALAGMAALWIWRWEEQSQAQVILNNTQVTSAPATRLRARAVPHQSLPLARHSRDARFLPDRRSQHLYRIRGQRPPSRRDVQARGYRGSRSRQAHVPGTGLSRRWGAWAVGPRPGPGGRSRVLVRRVCLPAAIGPRSNSPTCVSRMRSRGPAAPARPRVSAAGSTSSTAGRTAARRWAGGRKSNESGAPGRCIWDRASGPAHLPDATLRAASTPHTGSAGSVRPICLSTPRPGPSRGATVSQLSVAEMDDDHQRNSFRRAEAWERFPAASTASPACA